MYKIYLVALCLCLLFTNSCGCGKPNCVGNNDNCYCNGDCGVEMSDMSCVTVDCKIFWLFDCRDCGYSNDTNSYRCSCIYGFTFNKTSYTCDILLNQFIVIVVCICILTIVVSCIIMFIMASCCYYCAKSSRGYKQNNGKTQSIILNEKNDDRKWSDEKGNSVERIPAPQVNKNNDHPDKINSEGPTTPPPEKRAVTPPYEAPNYENNPFQLPRPNYYNLSIMSNND